jgi:hypothetical protein
MLLICKRSREAQPIVSKQVNNCHIMRQLLQQNATISTGFVNVKGRAKRDPAPTNS